MAEIRHELGDEEVQRGLGSVNDEEVPFDMIAGLIDVAL